MPPGVASPKPRNVNGLPGTHQNDTPRCCCLLPRLRPRTTALLVIGGPTGGRRIGDGLRMSPSASWVGSELYGHSPHDSKASFGSFVGPHQTYKSAPEAGGQRYPIAARSSHVDDRDDVATNAVATAFARIVAERYPGTSWLPVKSSRSDDRDAVPSDLGGKLLLYLQSPAMP